MTLFILRTRQLVALLIILSTAAAHAASRSVPEDRFVWIFGYNLNRQSDYESTVRLLRIASQNHINGAVLSANLDTLCKKPPEYFERLHALRDLCDELNVDLIPSLFSVGYGGATLSHNPHLAEGVPVIDAPFLVEGETASLIDDDSIRLANGGFENYQGDRLEGYRFHDQPGEVSRIDNRIFHGGKASLRMENFTANPHGHGRVMQEAVLTPHRCYRLSVWVKTEDLKPAEGFKLMALADGDRNIAPRSFRLDPTSDWRKLSMIFNSLEFDRVRIYAGIWGGKSGRFWLDDFSLEQMGPVNVLRRAGTPVTIRNEDGTVTYREGEDYEPLIDDAFRLYQPDHEAARLRIREGGRIREGQRLRVSWHHPMIVNESQITVCMAEPELYDIWEHEADLLAQHLRPKRLLLNMDEIRMGGTCQACGGRDMARLLGECVTRQTRILKQRFPDAEIYIWSDMLDPNHNAHADYYLVDGDYTGSWNHFPKDLRVAVWGGTPRRESLAFFNQQGFQTMIACYYDAADLEDVKQWMDAARDFPNVRGYMYTPWQRKYDLLPEFGRLIYGAISNKP